MSISFDTANNELTLSVEETGSLLITVWSGQILIDFQVVSCHACNTRGYIIAEVCVRNGYIYVVVL